MALPQIIQSLRHLKPARTARRRQRQQQSPVLIQRRENNQGLMPMATQNLSRRGRVKRVRSAEAGKCAATLKRDIRVPTVQTWA